ncbi:unnamed protein product [Blepharisma stoltei]|uniref:RRM domain-containing protein n=1 Tax=Blepharisma stoltei TaxID=1481888 RepID=A0AAU9IBM4_9CILI|nr:unnamed protein product [Blepharisma stoltei]
MEGPKRSNWADDSDEDLSEEEQPPKNEEAPQQSQSVTLSSSQPIKSLSSKIESASPPYCLKLCNISYDIRDENELYEFFGLTDEEIDEISIDMHKNERNQFKGSAALKMPNKEIALKIAKRDGDVLRNRDMSIYLDDGSYDGGRRRGRGRGDRGDRGDRGERRGERRNNGRGRYQQPQRSRYNNSNNYESRKEEKPKERPKIINSGKIVIAPSSEQSVKVEEEKLPPPPKPKSNPFGNAKPIDTLAKELEFERKRQQEEEEKRKEYEEKYEDYEQEELEEGEIQENPAENQEKPEEKVEEAQGKPQRYVKKSPRKEEPKVEEKTDEIKVKKPKAWGNDEETKKILSNAPPPVEVKPKTQYNSYKQGRHEKSGGRQGKYRVKQPRAQETNNE